MPIAERQPRVTIKDVARTAGVHFTTVSLALRHHPSIPRATRERIESIAKEIGYTPNPVFSALTHFRVHGRIRATPPRVAYLINHPLERFHHEQAFWNGAKEQAEMLGYELELISVSKGHHDSKSLARYLKGQNITGIIIAGFEPGLAELKLDWNDYAIVKINSLHMAPHTTSVSNDQRQDVRVAFREMLARGYRRIGLAVGRTDEESTQFRHAAGYLIERVAVPAKDHIPELLFPHHLSYEEVSALLGQWVRKHKVDAVLCNWASVDDLLERAGLRVPKDVACACLCLIDEATHLAGVCPNLHLVGVKAVSLLTSQLKQGTRGVAEFASSTYVRSRWQDGPSAPFKHQVEALAS
ncbi:MAG: LacI family DNA-binding transcriptional regulator [Nibricoccus sp.]